MHLWLGSLLMTTDTWVAIGAIAAAVQTLILIVAGIAAAVQVREASRSRTLTAQVQLFAELDSEQAQHERYQLYRELPDDLTQSLPRSQEAVIERMVAQGNFMGSMVRAKNISLDQFALSRARGVVRSWQRVSPWVEKQRQLRQTPFADQYEWLAAECARWIEERNPGEVVRLF